MQCQTCSCEPSTRGCGVPPQPGISSFVRRGFRPALASRYFIVCIDAPLDPQIRQCVRNLADLPELETRAAGSNRYGGLGPTGLAHVREILMDKKISGLLGAVAGLATMGSANAAVYDTPAAPLPAATSYAELLGPVDNAPALLVADDDARMQQSDVRVRLAQYHDHHHHHHHTKIIIRR